MTLDNASFQNYTIEIGYDQTDTAAFTTPYTLTGDTVTGMVYPIQVKAPSFSRCVFFSNIREQMVRTDGRTLPNRQAADFVMLTKKPVIRLPSNLVQT